MGNDMAAKIKNMKDLKTHINAACGQAVENAANRILGSLQRIIDEEFYDVFEPDFYHRSYQFFRSAAIKMLTQNSAQVFMDKDAMNYGSFWTGERQLREASAGSHGGWTTNETKEHRFWETFISFCQANAMNILKEELRKQHININ